MTERDIFITDVDHERLRNLLEGVRHWSARDRQHMEPLEAELDRAHVVRPEDIPADVVTMHTEVAIRDLDSGQEMSFTLAFPSEADVDRNRISVLAPVGTAVLGYRVGDTIEWIVPGRTRRLKIERVIFQPEAARQVDR